MRLGALFRRMGYVKRTALAAAVITAVAAVPAQAGTVIEVDGKSAHRVNDPAVPTRAEIAMPTPARAAAAGVVARASTKRGRRAVYATLRRELRRKQPRRYERLHPRGQVPGR